MIVGVELLGVVGLGCKLFGPGPFDPGALEELGDDEPLAAGVIADEPELVEFVPVELALVASAAVEVAEAGTTAGVFDGDDFVDLPSPLDLASPDFEEEPGAVTDGGVEVGGSSGIAGRGRRRGQGVVGRGDFRPHPPIRRGPVRRSAAAARGTLAPSICRRGRSPSQSVLRIQTRCETLRGHAGSRSSVTNGDGWSRFCGREGLGRSAGAHRFER